MTGMLKMLDVSERMNIFLIVTMIFSQSIGGYSDNSSSESTYDHHKVFKNEVTHHSQESFMDLVRQAGYDAEEHDVVTADGYILTMHRIPRATGRIAASYGKPVVLLMHGLLASSAVWVLRGPDQDLAYMLVDNGYDVWALNTRGNFYGKRHEKLTVDDAKFWRFSWHEFGTYDAAASIDYILSLTGQSQVSLIGHSMGGTMELVLLSKLPEYNAKVNVVLAFAPVAIVTHTFPGVFTSIGIQYGNQIEEALRLLNVYELFPRNFLNVKNYARLCQSKSTRGICQKMMLYLVGLTNFEGIDAILLPRLLNHYPQGTSIDTIFHYRQIILSGKFQEYNFGPMMNLMKYQNTTPPEYPLDKITAPIYLFYGPNDHYTTRPDIDAIVEKLKRATVREVPYPNFGHLDFIFLNDGRKYLYDEALHILNNYNDLNRTQNIITMNHLN